MPRKYRKKFNASTSLINLRLLKDINKRLENLETAINPDVIKLAQPKILLREKTIASIISKIRRSLNLNTIFYTVTNEVRQFLNADRVAIYKFNEDWSGEFIVDSVADGWTSLVHKQVEYPQLKDNVNDCSLKYLKQNYSSIQDTYLEKNQGGNFSPDNIFRVCNDIYKAGFSQCYLKTLELYEAKSYIIVAIFQNEKLWGLLATYQNSSARNWQEIEINFLVQISNNLEVAIHQAQLFQQCQTHNQELEETLHLEIQKRSEELEQQNQKEKALAEVIDKIRRTLNLKTIFQTATTEVRKLLNADRVGVFYFTPNTNYHEGQFLSESVLESYQSILNIKITDRCFGDIYVTDYANGRILAIDDIYEAGLSSCHINILSKFQIRANLILPLIKGKKLWGLLCIHQCNSPRQWQPEEVDFVQKIAIQLGVALQQSELLIKSKKRSQELQSALAQVKLQKEQQSAIAHEERTIGRIIGSIRQTLDIEQIFSSTTHEIRQTLNCDRTVVYRFFPDWSGEFVFESMSEGWTPLIVANMKTVWLDTHLQKTQGGRYANHEFFVVDNIYTAGHQDCHIELLEMFQIKAYIIAPVFAGDKLWGLLAAYQNTQPREWRDHEINLIVRIGDQLGIAVQQAELLQKIQETTKKAKAANIAKSDFLANMSHELRTPLNAILGFTQLLRHDKRLSQKQQDYIHIIGRSGEHLLNLLNDVLEMSKIEAGRMTLNQNDFDLSRLLKNIEEMFQLKVQSKGLKLNFKCSKEVPQYIQTDESKLRQVLINLVGNAIKFTEVGEVTLRCNYEKITNESNTIKHKLYFEIQDTGVGIAPQEIDSLFDAFVQTASGRNSQEGTGLGLPISQKFVQLMGGKINIDSVLNEGTLFSFDIDINLPENVPIQKTQSQRIIGLESNQPEYRILVVDDKWESRLILINMLSPLGFEVQEAENGQQALKIWEKWHPHLIWMDMRMPILNGYDATREIRKQERENNLGFTTKIIAITASVFDTKRSQIMDIGCNDFIAKPFREEIIYEKITEHLGVKYLYEDENIDFQNFNKISDKNNPFKEENLKSQLNQMPSEWLEKLHQLASTARESKILDLIEKIPPEYSDLTQYLTEMVKKLEFDKITDLFNN